MQARKLRVVIFGKINVDAYSRKLFPPSYQHCTKVNEFPGRPLGIVEQGGEVYICYSGGSGYNPAVALARLGLESVLVGAIGNDLGGRQILEQLKKEGVIPQLEISQLHTGLIKIGRDPATGERTFSPPTQSANSNLGDTRSDVSSVENLLRNADTVLISGWSLFGRPEERANRNFLDAVFNYAQSHGTEIVLDLSNAGIMLDNEHDARGVARSYAQRADIVKANREELQRLAGSGDLRNVIGRYIDLIRCGKENPRIILATLGAEGSAILDGLTFRSVKPCQARQVLDTNGAGDAYTATFVGLRLLGYETYAAAVGATYAGARVVTQFSGTAGLPNGEQVFQFLKEKGYVRKNAGR